MNKTCGILSLIAVAALAVAPAADARPKGDRHEWRHPDLPAFADDGRAEQVEYRDHACRYLYVFDRHTGQETIEQQGDCAGLVPVGPDGAPLALIPAAGPQPSVPACGDPAMGPGIGGALGDLVGSRIDPKDWEAAMALGALYGADPGQPFVGRDPACLEQGFAPAMPADGAAWQAPLPEAPATQPGSDAAAVLGGIGTACHEMHRPAPTASPAQRRASLAAKYACIERHQATAPGLAGSPDLERWQRFYAIERMTNERFIDGEISQAEAERLLAAARTELLGVAPAEGTTQAAFAAR